MQHIFRNGSTSLNGPSRSGLNELPDLIRESVELKKVNATVALTCFACSIVLFVSGGTSIAVAAKLPHLAAEQATAAARRDSNAGSSIQVLWKIVAYADSLRIGDQALEQAQAHRIKLFENGMLVNITHQLGSVFGRVLYPEG